MQFRRGGKSIRLNAADANDKLDQTRKNKERERNKLALFQNPVNCLHRQLPYMATF